MESHNHYEGKSGSPEGNYEQNCNSAQLQEILQEQLPMTEVELSGSDTSVDCDTGVDLKNMRDDIRVIKTVLMGFMEKTDIDVKESLRFNETKMWKELAKGMEGPLSEIIQGFLDGFMEETVLPVIRELQSAVSQVELRVPTSSSEDATPNIQDVINKAVRQEFEHVMIPAVACTPLEDGWMDYLNGDHSPVDTEIHAMNLAPISMDQDDTETEEGSDDVTIANLKQELAEHKKLIESLQKELRGKDETINGTIKGVQGIENLQMELQGKDETIKGLQGATDKQDNFHRAT